MNPLDLPKGWTMKTYDLGGARGWTLFEHRVILIKPGLHPWQNRATVTHELLHAHRGAVPAHMQAREERIVNRETARRLITIRDLAAALSESSDPRFVADRLEVPVALVWSRWHGLTSTERDQLLDYLN
ncbi:MAG: hypothetical protein Q4G35_14335 [Propionibacteriaceae bacterium]|nr:hypothetical protein [Propionibacteriaceae bacterium]